MATVEKVEKKFLSLDGLTTYDGKIKAHIDAADAATLEAAEKYADDLAENYEPAGAINTLVTTGQVKVNTDAIAEINDAENGILAQAKAHTDALTANEEGNKGKITVLEEKVGSLEGRADTVEGQVTTLVGDDTNKSVRAIANEELAKQLIAENAAESLNELQEIAAWIQSHPEDASAMNKAIEDLEALVGTLPVGEDGKPVADDIVDYINDLVAAEKARAEGIEGGLDERLQAVEAQFGTEGDDTVDARIEAAKQAAITAATEAAAADATAKDNVLSGKIDELASTDTEKPGRVTVVENRATTLESRADAVEDRVTDIETSLAEGGATALAIADAKKAGTDAQAAVDALTVNEEGNKGRITVLEERVDAIEAVTYVEITAEEIDKLFETTAA